MFMDEKDKSKRRVLMEQWIRDFRSGLSSEDIDHVIDCFESIYDWYEKGWIPGSFITAVLKNDFKMACFQSDDVNRRNLYLYAMFLHWHIPNDYSRKATALKY